MSNLKLNEKIIERIKLVFFIILTIPLVRLGIKALSDDLGANPIEKVTRVTGYWTLFILLLTLSVSPMKQIFGQTWLMRLRRMSGLFCFFYASLHFLTYLVLDQFFDWQSIIEDIAKRPYITVGFTVFLLLIPLAVTSTNSMVKRIGGKNWLQLHKLVYLCAIGGVIHFWWLVKKDITEPLRFALVLTLLLGYRLYKKYGKKFIFGQGNKQFS